jgi:hypothetical protein
MKLTGMTAFQLSKHLHRAMKDGNKARAKNISLAWAERIESGPAKPCFPKKKLRAAGLLPPVTHDSTTAQPSTDPTTAA